MEKKYTGSTLLIFSSISLAIPGFLIILTKNDSNYIKIAGIAMIIVSISSIIYHSTGNQIARTIDETIRNIFGAIFSLYAIIIGNLYPIIYGAISMLGYHRNSGTDLYTANINHALFVHLPVFLGFYSFLIF